MEKNKYLELLISNDASNEFVISPPMKYFVIDHIKFPTKPPAILLKLLTEEADEKPQEYEIYACEPCGGVIEYVIKKPFGQIYFNKSTKFKILADYPALIEAKLIINLW